MNNIALMQATTVAHPDNKQLHEEIARLELQNAELRKYAAHRNSCRAGGNAWRNNQAGPCDCGLAETLSLRALPRKDDDGAALARIIEDAQWP